MGDKFSTDGVEPNLEVKSTDSLQADQAVPAHEGEMETIEISGTIKWIDVGFCV